MEIIGPKQIEPTPAHALRAAVLEIPARQNDGEGAPEGVVVKARWVRSYKPMDVEPDRAQLTQVIAL